MRKSLIVVVVLVLAGLLAWRFLERAPQTAAPVRRELAPAAVEVPAVELNVPLAPAQESRREEAPTPAAVGAGDDAKPAAPDAAVADGKCELRGRFLLPGGAPAVGVALSVTGWESNQERVIRYGTPDHFDAPTGSSGFDGRFSVRFDPPPAYQFVLEGKLPRYCAASWRWSEIAAGKIVDVGDVELVRGGSVRGFVVDGKGNVQKRGWMVYGEGPRTSSTRDAEPVRVRAQPDAGTGEFLLEGLPPGLAHLTADSRIANWIEGPSVDVVAGQETKANITYSGPDIGSRITVVRFSNPFYVFDFHSANEDGQDASNDSSAAVAADGVFLTAPGFEERRAKKIEGSSQSWSFDDVPAGVYTVEVRDPRFLPWSKSGVRPGSSVDAKLEGNAAVVLSVVDDASGQPVGHYSLDVRFDGVNFSPNLFRILEAKDEPPHDGLFAGLVPHDQTLIVDAPGFAPCEIPAAGLAANERRVLTARLTHGLELRGTVVQGSAKTPVAGAKVQMRPASVPGSSTMTFSMDSDARTVEARSDAAGAFAFAGVAAGSYELSCSASPLVRATSSVTIVSGAAPKPLEIVLPSTGCLVGRIIAPEGASFAGLRVLTRPAPAAGADEDEMTWFFLPPEASVPVAADGTFRSPPVPAGKVSASLHCPEQTIPSMNGSSSFEGGHVDLGAFELQAGVDTHKEFDLRAEFPAFVNARVSSNGKPGAALIISCIAENGASAVAVADANGTCRIGPMLVGNYHVRVQPIDAAWLFVDPRLVTVTSGSAPTFDVAFALYDGTFVCKDASTHAPLANQSIQIAPDPNPVWANAIATLDDEGRAHLTLPAGRWRIDSKGVFFPDPSKPGAFVDWGPQGASPSEIELEPPPK